MTDSKCFHNTKQTVLRVTGDDREKFLEGQISNAIAGIHKHPIYAAILSPQGKYQFDFILTADADCVLIDIASDRAAALAQRLNMYKLRADVQIADSGLKVIQGVGVPRQRAFMDPRSDNIGWREYCSELPEDMSEMTREEWDQLRVDHIIPESGKELIPDETYILEAGFERLNGVDFKKGCYVGQEVTARMKHKTELKKGLVQVSVEGTPPETGTTIIDENNKLAGVLHTVAYGKGLAHLRFARAEGEMRAGEAIVRRT